MKLVNFSLGLAAAGLLLVGCSSNKTAPVEEEQQADTFATHCEYTPGVRAPEWYCNPEMNGGIAALGEAKPNAAGDNNFQRTEAMANGRDALARQLEVKVSNMFKNFTATTGEGVDATYDKATENVSRQVAQQTLSGSKQINRWVAPDGTLVLLIGLAESSPVIDSIKSSMKNEKALWQKFQAQKAQEELDKYLEKEFGQQQ